MATTKATTLAHTLGGISSDISTAEINRLDNLTGDIQTQLDAKAPLASPTFSGNVSATNIKHASSGSNNLVLASDGNVSITNTLSAGTIGGNVQRASGYPFAMYEITTTTVVNEVQIVLNDGDLKIENGGIDLANSNKDIVVPSAGLYEIILNLFFSDTDDSRYHFIRLRKHSSNITSGSTGTQIFYNGTNNCDIGGADATQYTYHGSCFALLSANDHISLFCLAEITQSFSDSAGTTDLTSYVAVRKIYDT